jgi:ABC-type Fe3+-siderophore transport system permease subunit
MNYDFKLTGFPRAVTAGVATGFIATIVALIYNIVYREEANFQLNGIISVSSIIFAVMLVFTIIGMAYYLFDANLSWGTIGYIMLMLVLTFLCIRVAINFQRSDDPVLAAGFRKLFIGIIVICSAFAIVMVPYLVKKENSLI